MKVKKLIRLLKKCNPNCEVFIRDPIDLDARKINVKPYTTEVTFEFLSRSQCRSLMWGQHIVMLGYE